MTRTSPNYLRYQFQALSMTSLTDGAQYFTATGFKTACIRVDINGGAWAGSSAWELQESIDGTNWTKIGATVTDDGEQYALAVRADRLRLKCTVVSSTASSTVDITVVVK